MRQILQPNFSVIQWITEKSKPNKRDKPLPFLFSFTCIFILFFTAHSVFANHFKGGYFTYKYLGNGKYEFLVRGYWDKSEVNTLYPRYGAGASVAFPTTISKTLLPDGQTIEHLQKQIVSWSTPGLKQIYYDPCCMGTGSNFDQNPRGIWATLNYDPNVANSSAEFFDYPLFNFEAGKPINHKMNIKDPDGQEQEFSLEIPNGLTADAYSEMVGFQLQKDGTIVWDNPKVGSWLVLVRAHEKVNGVLNGIYIDRLFIMTIIDPSGNKAPTFTSTPSKIVRTGQALSFEVEASDTVGQNVMISANGIPFGASATFTQNTQGNIAKGTFNWTPAIPGTYNVEFVANDDDSIRLYSRQNVEIRVVDCMDYTPNFTLTKPCAGSNNGKIVLQASAGYSPYQYSLDSGATFQSSPNFESLAPGQYIALIKDAAGCLSTTQNITLEEAPLPVVSFTLPTTICANTPTFTLSGSPEGGIFSGTGVENGSFYPNKAGAGTFAIYYKYTDGNGCSNVATKQITVTDALVADAGLDTQVEPRKNNQVKKKNCTTLTANATGGKAPYSYQWSTGETSQSIYVCPTDSTTYFVTVTDALGCSDESQVAVTINNKNGTGNTGNSSVPEVTIYPNPVTEQSSITVVLPKADNLTISIINFSDFSSQTIYDGKAPANQELVFKLNDKLKKNNFYILSVMTSHGIQFFRLMVL